MTTLEAIAARTYQRLAPPPRLTISDWADRERVLAPESSAEPGRWRTDRTPYLRAVMDALSDRHVETVVMMASSQVGKTEVLLNALGYYMHLDPSPILFIQPTLQIASAISKDRIAPMIRSTPVLEAVVAHGKSRAASNTILHRSFIGGQLTLAGANSPASLAGRPIRILLADEVDRWPASAGEEGDPLILARKRTTTFRRRKIVVVSTPKIKDASRIEEWYNISDRRQWHTPCPRCGDAFVLAWEHIRFEDRDPSTARIECPLCEGRIEERERLPMVAAGHWRASAPFAGIAGFHMWEGFSPFVSLQEQVATFLVARQSLETRQAWTNTSLGKPWEVPGDKIEAASLLSRREQYAAELPAGVKVLTCGVDTQDDRLEALVVGWGDGEECWLIAHAVASGDPARAEVWGELDELLGIAWGHEMGGALRVYCTLVDAGGHKTQGVYNAVIPRQRKRVYACKGKPGGESGLMVSPPKILRPKQGSGTVHHRMIDSDQAKVLIYGRMKKITEPGPEYIHYPMSLGQAFFDQLTSQRLITKRNKYGVPTKSWEQIRERDEALACLVLAFCSLRVVAPTPQQFTRLAGSLEMQRIRVA